MIEINMNTKRLKLSIKGHALQTEEFDLLDARAVNERAVVRNAGAGDLQGIR